MEEAPERIHSLESVAGKPQAPKPNGAHREGEDVQLLDKIKIGRWLQADAPLVAAMAGVFIAFLAMPWLFFTIDRVFLSLRSFLGLWLGSGFLIVAGFTIAIRWRISLARRALSEKRLRRTRVAKVGKGESIITVVPEGESAWQRRPAVVLATARSRRIREGDEISLIEEGPNLLCATPLILELLAGGTAPAERRLDEEEDIGVVKPSSWQLLVYVAIGLMLLLVPGEGFIGSVFGKILGAVIVVSVAVFIGDSLVDRWKRRDK